MRISGCDECARLWEKYTDAAFDFMRLDAQVRVAALQFESLQVMALLTEGVAAAAQRRDVALARLKEHEVTHQMRSAAAS